jgi:nucleoid-associated protein YgaU
MTRDAKIGLLLGLAFIFVIAFIVNGLPSLRGDKNKDTNELTAGLVNMPKNSPGIGARERELINRRESVNNRIHEFQNVPIMDPLIRYQTDLPQEKGPSMARSNASDLQRSDTVKTVDIGQVQVKRPVVEGSRIVMPARPQAYVVKDGDNLSTIALQFYGSEQGNKIAIITALFKANSRVLKSPDDIYVGQKLIIPPLSDLTGEKEKSSGGLTSAIFEKVTSIGRERLTSKKAEAASRGKSYTVRDGDSLWKIASDQLGDGNRYPEIAKLNDEVLSDEDSLTVGMTLKMPGR